MLRDLLAVVDSAAKDDGRPKQAPASTAPLVVEAQKFTNGAAA